MGTDDVLMKSENANAMQSWISKDGGRHPPNTRRGGYEKSFQTVCYELPVFTSRDTGELDVAEIAKNSGNSSKQGRNFTASTESSVVQSTAATSPRQP